MICSIGGAVTGHYSQFVWADTREVRPLSLSLRVGFKIFAIAVVIFLPPDVLRDHGHFHFYFQFHHIISFKSSQLLMLSFTSRCVAKSWSLSLLLSLSSCCRLQNLYNCCCYFFVCRWVVGS